MNGGKEGAYPRNQVIQKTDLAKYKMSFRPAPHVVSTGAQKCFLEFAKEIDGQWQTSRTTFNDAFFREMVAKAIIFRWIDKHVGTSDWYKEDRQAAALVGVRVNEVVTILRDVTGHRG